MSPLAVAWLFCLALTAACSPSSSESSKESRIVVGFQSAPDTLDPVRCRTARAETILSELLDLSLLRHDPVDDRTKPWLAESLPTRDGEGWIWTLPQEARRGDGRRVLAEDAAATARFLQANPGEAGELAAAIQGLIEISVLDAHRFRTRFEDPTRQRALAFGRVFHLLPLAEETAELDDAWGAGPYGLLSHDRSRSQFRKKKDWWGAGLARFEGRFETEVIEFRYIADQPTLSLLFREGAIDLAGLPASGPAPEGEDIEILQVPTGAMSYVVWNTEAKPLDSKILRSSLARTLPRRKILEQFAPGTAVAITIPFGSAEDLGSRDDFPRIEDFTALPGFSRRDATLHYRNAPYRFRVLVPVGAGWAEKAAESWRETLRQLGIQLVVERLEVRALLARLTARDFDACLLIWKGKKARKTLRGMLHSEETKSGGRNFSGLRDDALDAAIKALEEAEDGEPLMVAEKRLDDIVRDLAPVTMLFRHQARIGMRSSRIQVEVGAAGLDLTTLRSR